MAENEFDRSKHVYNSPDFDEIIKDTIRFFNGTPVHVTPPPIRFHGTGVYAIYCVSKLGIYSRYHLLNRTSFRIPIYIGKAVPKGWRQARNSLSKDSKKTYELYTRLREHSRSIELGKGIELSDYCCRFMILENREVDLIGTVEAALIRKYKPLWNTVIDGFGNHDPGSGRYEQARSDWDVCHPGRLWADKCKGEPSKENDLLDMIVEALNNLGEDNV